MSVNITDHGRFGAIVDRLQEQLNRDPEEFERVLDIIEEVI